MNYAHYVSLLIILLGHCILLEAQEQKKLNWSKNQQDHQLKVGADLQIKWKYTLNQKLYNAETEQYEKVDNRWNLHIRRFRFNFTGEVYTNLSFNFKGAIDLVGRDVLAATLGGANNGSAPNFGLLNAYLQWRLLDQKETLWLTFGYLVPQISRSSITSAMRATSFEKAWVQNYMRRSLVGIGPGRAPGINLGGQVNTSDQLAISYDFGFFNPVNANPIPNTTGRAARPLFTSRVVFHFGEPESAKYSLSHQPNHFGQRNGLSIALTASHRGRSDLFEMSQSIGTDWLLNLGGLNIDGEWNYLYRARGPAISQAQVGYFRTSYVVPLREQRYLEPVFMYVRFKGAADQLGQRTAESLGTFAGKDEILNWTLNYYFNPNFKLAFSYTQNQGNLGEALPGAEFNNYYFQGGVGAINRGDLMGMAMVLII